jgi:teichuronic acid exporter
MTESSGAPPAKSSLALHLVDSFAWTALGKLCVQVIGWGCTLLVARLLSPADFGVVTATIIYVGLLALFSEFGIGSAVVNIRDLSEAATRQLNMLAVLVSVGMFVGVCAASVPVAAFFRIPELTSAGFALGLGLPLAGLRAVPNGLLQKQLRYRALAGIESAQSLVQAIATVSLAFFGFRYWALILGSLAGLFVGAMLAVAAARQGFAWPRLRSIRQALGFARPVLIANVLWYTYSNADFAIAGKVLGRTALGEYSLAWSLATMPADKLGAVITRVMPGFFSAQQRDAASLRRYLCEVTRAIAIVTFPILFGMAAIGREFVVLIVGAKWEPAAAPLRFLCVYASMAALVPLWPQVLSSVGKPQLAMWSLLPKIAALPVAFVVGTRWGAVGIAAAWAVVYPFTNILLGWWTFRAIELRISDYVRAIRGPLLSGVAMTVAVLAVGSLQDFRALPLALRFGVQTMLGALVYVATLIALDHRALMTYWPLVRAWLGRRRQSAS